MHTQMLSQIDCDYYDRSKHTTSVDIRLVLTTAIRPEGEIAELTSSGIGIEGVRRILDLEVQVDALRSRNEELVAELEATREALRRAMATRQSTPSGNKLPVLHQAAGQSLVVWRRPR